MWLEAGLQPWDGEAGKQKDGAGGKDAGGLRLLAGMTMQQKDGAGVKMLGDSGSWRG